MLIPLKEFIIDYLSTLYIKNIFTNKSVRALDIFNWDSSGALDILIANGYMVETKYNYATNEKEFGLVRIDKKDKIIGYKEETKIVPIETLKYRYINSDEIKRYKVVIEPVYKYVKIGKQTYYTTQYKRVKIPIYKKKRQYYTIVDYKYETIRKPIIKKSYKYIKIMHNDYIVYFLYEKYKYDSASAKIDHSLWIAPFYSSHGQALAISVRDSLNNVIPSTPEELTLGSEYKNFLSACKQAMFTNTTQKESVQLLKNHIRNFKKKKQYKSSYSYSEDILDTVFFTYATTKGNTIKENLSEENFNMELEK